MFHFLRVQAAKSVLTPRAMSWLRNLARIVPEDQGSTIALAFVESSYTSVEVIKEEDTDNILAIPGIKSLKPGAMAALMKKLAELKVCPPCHTVLLSLMVQRPIL